MKTLTLVLVLLALPLPSLAQGQTIWRCGADGRSYSATPCSEGLALQTDPSPSAAEQAEARRVARIDERLAAQMRNDRLRSEAASQRVALAGFQTTMPGPAVRAGSAKAAKAAKHHRPEAAGTWRAAGPSSRRAKG
jgi:hypothetical protein